MTNPEPEKSQGSLRIPSDIVEFGKEASKYSAILITGLLAFIAVAVSGFTGFLVIAGLAIGAYFYWKATRKGKSQSSTELEDYPSPSIDEEKP